tara:strand:+ start:11605 stop:11922 length:318 start_codon:yes stop_codon:yes gene_type:complete
MYTSDITIDVSNIKFCPGPCNSIVPESEPVKIANKNWYNFKPHTGGRYDCLSYPIGMYSLSLLNVRMCRRCNKRNLEFWEEQSYEDLQNDAKIILKKLENHKNEY